MKKALSISLLFIVFAFSACDKGNETSLKGILFSLKDPSETGVNFTNKITETPQEHIYTFNYIYNGAGVGIGDFNNDGLQDLYFVGNQFEDKLYLNKGNLKFEDISVSAGISKLDGWRSGISIVDINHDGYLDIYITRGGFFNDPIKNANLLLINQKDLTFRDEAASYGIADPGYSIAANFFDYDNDNDLDLFVTNRPAGWGIGEDSIQRVKSKQMMGIIEPLTTDKLYKNNGNKTFTDVTKEAGLYPNFGYGLAAVAGDINNDGTQDLYVANDFIENDYFFVNFGNGQFRQSTKELTNHVPYYSMGVDFGDINNDGEEEIFVVEMRPDEYKRSKTTMPAMKPEFFVKLKNMGFADQYMHNVLQYNHGNGFFTDISQLSGVEKTDWSWAPLISDLDNDGFKDIYITNGYRRDVYDRDTNEKIAAMLKKSNNVVDSIEQALGLLPSVKLVNYVYQNKGNLIFKKMMNEWGITQPSFSNGAALGDLDNDGDLDLVVNNIDDPAFIYENNANGQRNYLRLKFNGPSTNTFGIGVKITVEYGKEKQYQQFKTTRGYLSACEPYVHFGMNKTDKADRVIVEWQDGKKNILNNVKVNQTLIINYSEAALLNEKEFANIPFFIEATASSILPPFYHFENFHNDYNNQILLPHSLSKIGPFVAVGDVNNDFMEDFYIGGAHGQSGQLYMQNDSGNFRVKKVPVFELDKDYEDIGTVFFDADGDTDQDLYVVSGGTEFPEDMPAYQDRLYFNDGKGNFSKDLSSLPKIRSSGSCIVPGDFDGDGDLDLFRGGRTIPEKYPYPPKSYLLENIGGGKYKDVTDEKAPELRNIGMVTSAVWTPLRDSNTLDLLVVGEWMPITVFENMNGKFTKVALDKYGLENTEGWWNRIAAADLDKDGDIDYVVGNLGLNYKFHTSLEKPFQVYCNDFDKNGTYDIVLAKYNGGSMVPVRGRQCSSEQMPFISKKYPTYNEFANATLDEMYGEELNKGLHYKANIFESVILLREKGKLVLKTLPIQAQFSTVQGIIPDDFDEDGKMDILLAGNLFNAEIETTRADASVGLLLQGTGGSDLFKPLSVKESGVFVPYDVKDIKPIVIRDEYSILVASNNMALFFLRGNK